MTEEANSSDLVVRAGYDVQLYDFELAILETLTQNGLPTESVFVKINERLAVSRNIGNVLTKISHDQRQRSVYISKFVAAVAVGLFDSALNYLWDETIFELRKRVARYDLSYFYDNAVRNPDKRKNLKTTEDLVNIDDGELIHGAKAIGLISELGFKHLDYIRFMRNWASAAHPNQNEITGLQLISWLETCIREVISLPLSDIAVEIKRLLANVRANSISDTEAREIAVFFLKLTQHQVNNLASGFFGIYTRLDTTSQTRQNIHRLLPPLWERVDETTRQQFGIKYGTFVANNDQEKNLARQFLELVSALPYIPDALRAAEIETAIDNLLIAHRGLNNFYNEPPFARELQRLVGNVGKVPEAINEIYVLGLVEVFLTNGNGITRSADPIYRTLIDHFNSRQALIAILSFNDTNIASRLQFPLCQRKYRELLGMMKIKVSESAVKELIDDIEGYTGSLDIMKDNNNFRRKVNILQKILG